MDVSVGAHLAGDVVVVASYAAASGSVSGCGGPSVGAGDGFRDVSEASAPASSGIGFGSVIIGRKSAGTMGDGRIESRIIRGSVASGGFGRR